MSRQGGLRLKGQHPSQCGVPKAVKAYLLCAEGHILKK
jgi:hypothetical protein